MACEQEEAAAVGWLAVTRSTHELASCALQSLLAATHIHLQAYFRRSHARCSHAAAPPPTSTHPSRCCCSSTAAGLS